MKFYKNMIFTGVSLCIIALMYIFFGNWKMPSRKDNSQTLIVGTNAEYAPFSFIKDGSFAGFDIDLITLVAQRLGKKLIIKDMSFSALLPQLQIGSIQVIAAGLSATPERAEHVFFTKPYLVGSPFVIVSLLQKPINSIEELQGKQVIVNEGFVADMYVSNLPGISLRRLATTTDALMALQSGRADAFVTSQVSLQPFFELHPSSDYKLVIIPDTIENTVFAVSKKYNELLPLIQRALDELNDDGTLETLKRKWHLS